MINTYKKHLVKSRLLQFVVELDETILVEVTTINANYNKSSNQQHYSWTVIFAD